MRRRNNNNGIVHLDDGGAAKSSVRRNRRRRKNMVEKVIFPIIIIAFVVFVIRHSSSIATQRQKARKIVNGFMREQRQDGTNDDDPNTYPTAEKYTYSEDHQHRWAKESILPPPSGQKDWAMDFFTGSRNRIKKSDFKLAYGKKMLDWEDESQNIQDRPPLVDYTKHTYSYPEITSEPPRGGSYPPMDTLGNLMKKWPQNNYDNPPDVIEEKLQHFDFNDPKQLEIAKLYRDLEFPFKLTNVPELIAANAKWTDEYLSFHFDRKRKALRNVENTELNEKYGHIPPSDGHCQESIDSFFAFFTQRNWNIKTMGAPPTKDTDFTYARWAKHARYADSVRLLPTKKHYYWQSGATAAERKIPKDQWTVISVDLPSFSDPEPNFISFNPKESKGIQCRMGERGVTAATHYDGGRNMVGMITGAKRYILAPPLECPKVRTFLISIKKSVFYTKDECLIFSRTLAWYCYSKKAPYI